MWWPWKRSTSPDELTEKTMGLIRDRLRKTPDHPFRPWTSETTSSDAVRAKGALDRVREETPSSEHVYFDTSRARYAAIVQLALDGRDAPPNRILDVGCAPGHVSMALTLLGANVTGLDLNDLYLPKYPSKQWVERLGVRAHNIEEHDLPFEDETFDGVLFCEVLEHIATRPPGEIFDEIRRVLKPGGMLISTVPNLANISQVLALCMGRNVMWAPEIFYGSLDRHNREYVPHEFVDLIRPRFARADYFMMNAEHNWNGAANAEARSLGHEALNLSNHPVFYNTLMARARK